LQRSEEFGRLGEKGIDEIIKKFPEEFKDDLIKVLLKIPSKDRALSEG
jgi:hypothetical protein